jgi:hypothetical protein
MHFVAVEMSFEHPLDNTRSKTAQQPIGPFQKTPAQVLLIAVRTADAWSQHTSGLVQPHEIHCLGKRVLAEPYIEIQHPMECAVGRHDCQVVTPAITYVAMAETTVSSREAACACNP